MRKKRKAFRGAIIIDFIVGVNLLIHAGCFKSTAKAPFRPGRVFRENLPFDQAHRAPTSRLDIKGGSVDYSPLHERTVL